MIYEIPKHKTTIDLSKMLAISWYEYVSAKKVSWWKFLLSLGWFCSSPEKRAHIKIRYRTNCAVLFDYDTDKDAKKVYNDLVKAWKEK